MRRHPAAQGWGAVQRGSPDAHAERWPETERQPVLGHRAVGGAARPRDRDGSRRRAQSLSLRLFSLRFLWLLFPCRSAPAFHSLSSRGRARPCRFLAQMPRGKTPLSGSCPVISPGF